MAQRVSIVLEDDIDGSEATQTVTFGLDGTNYEIDLNDTHAGELRSALASFISAGRRSGGVTRRRGRTTTASGNGPSAADMRAWAQENGHNVPERGRIPAGVREAYDAAH